MITPRFFDSLLRKNLPAPTDPGTRSISFYACGITPYSEAHIGHARSYVVFDAMAQTLRWAGHDVGPRIKP